MLTDNSFQRLSDPVGDLAESLTLRLLKRIKRIALLLSRDPDRRIELRALMAMVCKEHGNYLSNAKEWVNSTLPIAYLKGIQQTNGYVRDLGIDTRATSPIGRQLLSGGQGGNIVSKARQILDEYPNHHTMYAVFQQSAYEDFSRSLFPVVRDVEGKIRELIILASESEYRDADSFTRRQLSQELMRRFADNNITGITYSDGRRVNLDSYAELVARSQTGNAARQASLNRQQQYGLDYVRISTHYPCSDLCYEEQGNVYSISGVAGHYPPLSEAIAGGLYHANCKHYQNPYVPGLSGKQNVRQTELSKKENLRRYELQQRQRQIERYIKSYKRREATALTDQARKKARAKVRYWQKQQRQLVDSHSFLRRKYSRESING